MKNKLVVLALAAMSVAAPSFASTVAPRQNPLAISAFPLPVPQYLVSVINEAAKQYGVDPNLVAAMAFRESRFDPNAVSQRGAQGVMQLMPRTAQALGVHDAFDARQNVFGGTKYVKYLLDRFHGNIDNTLAAYNAGPELVAKAGPTATAEATAYVAAVKSYYETALRAL